MGQHIIHILYKEFDRDSFIGVVAGYIKSCKGHKLYFRMIL